MQSQANKDQFLKQFEQIVDGVKNNKAKVIIYLTFTLQAGIFCNPDGGF